MNKLSSDRYMKETAQAEKLAGQQKTTRLPDDPNAGFWTNLRVMVKGLGGDDVEEENLQAYVSNMQLDIEQSSIKKTSRIAFTLAIQRYLKFMGNGPMRALQAWPPTHYTIMLYLRYIQLAKHSYASMRQIYFAINWRLRNEGLPEVKHNVIKQMMGAAAIKLLQRVKRKHALNPDMHKKYHQACMRAADSGQTDMVLVSAIAATQYLGIARISEILNADRGHLHLELGPMGQLLGMSLDYKGKCDTIREGHTKYIEKLSNDEYCATFKVYEMLRTSERLSLPADSAKWNEPLFQWKGKRITYGWLMPRMKRMFKIIGLKPALFASHSFRSGATTAALARGCPKYLVKRQGGWRSEAIDAYFIPSYRQLYKVSAAMGMGETASGAK